MRAVASEGESVLKRVGVVTLAVGLLVGAANAQVQGFRDDSMICAALYQSTASFERARRNTGSAASLFGGNDAQIDFAARAGELTERDYLDEDEMFSTIDLMFARRFEGLARPGDTRTISRTDHAAMLIACDRAHGFEPVLQPADKTGE